MKKLITLATINLVVSTGVAGNKLTGLAPVKPKSVEIPMGYLYTPRSEEEYDELLDLGAAREIIRGKDDLDQYKEFILDERNAKADNVTGRAGRNTQTIEGVGVAPATVVKNEGEGGELKAGQENKNTSATKVAASKVKPSTSAKTKEKTADPLKTKDASAGSENGEGGDAGGEGGDANDVV